MSRKVHGKPLSDMAWALIEGARGQVRGKVLRMSPDTLARIFRERGVVVPGNHTMSNPHLHGRRLYGVEVQCDAFLLIGRMELGERQ